MEGDWDGARHEPTSKIAYRDIPRCLRCPSAAVGIDPPSHSDKCSGSFVVFLYRDGSREQPWAQEIADLCGIAKQIPRMKFVSRVTLRSPTLFSSMNETVASASEFLSARALSTILSGKPESVKTRVKTLISPRNGSRGRVTSTLPLPMPTVFFSGAKGESDLREEDGSSLDGSPRKHNT